MRNELFAKALRVEVEELRAELMLGTVRELTDAVWDKLHKETQILITPGEFYELIAKEAEERQWDLKFYRNKKNEPVQNLFKKVIKQICKSHSISLSNDVLSRILNEVRRHYGEEAILSAGLYPAEAFRERSKYDIPSDLGDTNSCFRYGGCNEGNALWLIEEDKKYDRAKLVVFHYQSGSRVGYGRCWVYSIPGAIYATNFYSLKFEIKDDRFNKPIVRLIRKLFGLPENVKFAMGKNAPLPIYLNGDGIVIYDPSQYTSSGFVLDEINRLYSICLWCFEEVEMKSLMRYSSDIYYSPMERRVGGLIVCVDCAYQMNSLAECIDCGQLFDPNDAGAYIEGEGYICRECYEDRWFHCDSCGEVYRREDCIITPDGKWLCIDCASKLGERCVVCGEFFYYDKEEEDEITVKQYKITYRFSTRVEYVCDKCAEKYLKIYQCEECGGEVKYLSSEYMRSEILRDMVRLGLCIDCYYEKRRGAHDSAFCGIDYPSLFMQAVDPAERVLREVLETE